ncbi:cytochrome P450 family protein [Kitasatospora mediocidica]|uniref:cytochrome P450 n=1 Tax=Kitasatospora mediocidica TaxID=58352 RepID=UPI000A8AC067|nr:cytochrome P450 [Kitasatospora mediocidica]
MTLPTHPGTHPRIRAARSADRLVYLASHPALFGLLTVTRRRPVVRVGRTVLVHDAQAYHHVLTRVPLDRTAEGTTGGAAARLTDGDQLFDQDGGAHRSARREVSALLGAPGVAALRPLWRRVLAERLTELPERTDLVPIVRELAGVTVAALTGSSADPTALARAACDAATAAARDHLPTLLPPLPALTRRPSAQQAVGRLASLLPDGRDAALAVAAVNTTMAALPRAAAWCARAGLWAGLGPDTSPALAVELLRLTAPSPILPRVAAADATVAGCPIRRGDRLILVARHAAQSHRDTPDDPPAAAQAVFGAGPHGCPGAALARAQLADFLTALAPHAPRVLRSTVDRRAALPGYAALLVGKG